MPLTEAGLLGATKGRRRRSGDRWWMWTETGHGLVWMSPV